MIALLFDTAELERQQDELLEETQLISDMVQATIKENATTALDQQEYQKHYDSLSGKFEESKTKLEKVMSDLETMQQQKAEIETFIKQFQSTPDVLTEFNLDVWNSLVDHATVYTRDDIRFAFKNGQEIKA